MKEPRARVAEFVLLNTKKIVIIKMANNINGSNITQIFQMERAVESGQRFIRTTVE